MGPDMVAVVGGRGSKAIYTHRTTEVSNRKRWVEIIIWKGRLFHEKFGVGNLTMQWSFTIISVTRCR